MQKREQCFEGINLDRKPHLGITVLLLGLATATAQVCVGQQPEAPAPQPQAVAKQPRAATPIPPAPGAPLRLTLQDALPLARKNEPTYTSIATAAGVAGETRAQSRDALLPSVNFNTSVIYTQGSNLPGSVRFIANNAPH